MDKKITLTAAMVPLVASMSGCSIMPEVQQAVDNAIVGGNRPTITLANTAASEDQNKPGVEYALASHSDTPEVTIDGFTTNINDLMAAQYHRANLAEIAEEGMNSD